MLRKLISFAQHVSFDHAQPLRASIPSGFHGAIQKKSRRLWCEKKADIAGRMTAVVNDFREYPAFELHVVAGMYSFGEFLRREMVITPQALSHYHLCCLVNVFRILDFLPLHTRDSVALS